MKLSEVGFEARWDGQNYHWGHAKCGWEGSRYSRDSGPAGWPEVSVLSLPHALIEVFDHILVCPFNGDP